LSPNTATPPVEKKQKLNRTADNGVYVPSINLALYMWLCFVLQLCLYNHVTLYKCLVKDNLLTFTHTYIINVLFLFRQRRAETPLGKKYSSVFTYYIVRTYKNHVQNEWLSSFI